MAQSNWSLTQIRKLLPLDDDSLQQILDYSSSLSKDASAEHLKNLLGDSPQALEFISSFNARRPVPVIVAPDHGLIPPVPKSKGRKKKDAFNKLHVPPPRQVEGQGNIAGGYIKRNDDNLKPGRTANHNSSHSRNASSDARSSDERGISPGPSKFQAPTKLPPSASGRLISDPKPKATPATTKSIKITGGVPMKGKSTALSDLDIVIRALEIQTNPTLTPTPEENARRKCNCMATRHDLLAAAPNCMNCGKIICVKEGIGPCTFCSNALLSAEEVASMIRVLREESGREKQALNNSSYKRAEVAKTPRPFAPAEAQHTNSSPGTSAPSSDAEGEKLAAAKRHRDKLLSFQANNARRTRVHDEAADFDTPNSGQNIWATPVERAMELKKQQKALREQEWRSRPEYEKRRVVASIDLVGGKVVRRMATVDRPKTPESDGEDDYVPPKIDKSTQKTTFGRNPLLGALIRPVAPVQSKGKGPAGQSTTKWRRVQDDNDDNERWILDGGLQGESIQYKNMSEEPPCG